MRHGRVLAAAASVGLVGALALPAAVGADRTNVNLFARLKGSEEVPGPGDPNGRGFARISVDTEDGEICYKILVRRIDPATMAHIHEGDRGVAGPVVQGLEPPTDGTSSGCVINEMLADELVANPSDYYVNVHNTPYPAGAVRGQLR